MAGGGVRGWVILKFAHDKARADAARLIVSVKRSHLCCV